MYNMSFSYETISEFEHIKYVDIFYGTPKNFKA